MPAPTKRVIAALDPDHHEGGRTVPVLSPWWASCRWTRGHRKWCRCTSRLSSTAPDLITVVVSGLIGLASRRSESLCTCFVQSALRCRRRIDRSFVTPFALRRLRRPQPRLTIPARRLPVSFAYADLQARRAIHDSQIAGYRFTHRAARRHRAPLVMRSRHARVPFAPPGWFCVVLCRCVLPSAARDKPLGRMA